MIKRAFAAIGAAAVGAVAVFAVTIGWPLYMFMAHDGDAPLLPWGWVTMPTEAPFFDKTYDVAYNEAAHDTMEAMQAHWREIKAPGMTAAVAVGGKIVWEGTVGFADLKSGAPMTNDTVLRVGSTSKAITATALARLVEEGVLGLDDPITDYLPTDSPEAWSSITPRMLASHMAGLPHYGDNEDWDGKAASFRMTRAYPDMREALTQFDEAPLLFEPGTEFSYSSLGTVLLGAVMSYAADTNYSDLITEDVLTAAGATQTFPAPKGRGERGDLATFYVRRGDQYRPWRPVDLSHRLPGGGWASTSRDLVRIGSLWLQPGFISDETREAFWTPQTLSSGEVNEQGYAIGWRWREWEIEGVPLARNANHGGVSKGAQSWLLVYPDLEMVIAFNINGRTDEFRDFGSFYEPIYAAFARDALAAQSLGEDG